MIYLYGVGSRRGDYSGTMELPKWLDDCIFGEQKAEYSPSYSDMTNIDDDKAKTLNYLGTYFPRSYAEAYCIFSEYFQHHADEFATQTALSVFDFGCGTGGEIIGLLAVIDECLPHVKKVRVVALDGNQHALRIYEKILKKAQSHIRFEVENNAAPIMIDDFYDLHILNKVLDKQFDLIISFKAICELVTKDQFEKQNAYEHIAKFLMPKLTDNGLMLLEDVTTYNNTSQEWLPMMMDNGLKAAYCKVVSKNEGYNQIYTITHSHKHNDVSKVAWRIIKR